MEGGRNISRGAHVAGKKKEKRKGEGCALSQKVEEEKEESVEREPHVGREEGI